VRSSATSLAKQVAAISGGGSDDVNYWRYLPPRSCAPQPPALIFLHGRDERARENDPMELDRVLKEHALLTLYRGDGNARQAGTLRPWQFGHVRTLRPDMSVLDSARRHVLTSARA